VLQTNYYQKFKKNPSQGVLTYFLIYEQGQYALVQHKLQTGEAEHSTGLPMEPALSVTE
jgi:hypothetical protein